MLVVQMLSKRQEGQWRATRCEQCLWYGSNGQQALATARNKNGAKTSNQQLLRANSHGPLTDRKGNIWSMQDYPLETKYQPGCCPL